MTINTLLAEPITISTPEEALAFVATFLQTLAEEVNAFSTTGGVLSAALIALARMMDLVAEAYILRDQC